MRLLTSKFMIATNCKTAKSRPLLISVFAIASEIWSIFKDTSRV